MVMVMKEITTGCTVISMRALNKAGKQHVLPWN